ncbi:hypothetical protein MYRNA_201 [Mycobacterium phage Myrna]|uniref:Uncharacterized protein n=1 Tax=Mycobacterium phage Myrna TaxID=546805 RepID=B5LJH3_9CAUD|nr:gp201 [Mycobacterium phage Myrna]ACH62170.1 hypothetical protein MYRNA_201 [Mycobacterium phage Myrna]
MGRQLPSYDPDKDGPYDTSKRRREIFKRVYQNMERWRAQQEDYGMSPFMESPDGETIYYGDLMTGLPVLAATAPQQLKAFERICLKEYTESAATAEILPDSKWSTPVQQYSDDALRKMIAAYDAVQDGTWDPVEAVKKKKRRPPQPKEDPIVTSVETAPEVPEDVQDETPLKSSRIAHLDWTTCSAENQRLADYINSIANVGITGQQVKALAFLRKPWYRSAEEQAIRKEEADRKEAEKAKYAYETDEQRAKRFEAARRLKAAEAAQEKARQAMEEVRQLRIEAGLDPDTGEPANAA